MKTKIQSIKMWDVVIAVCRGIFIEHNADIRKERSKISKPVSTLGNQRKKNKLKLEQAEDK